jgi:hypothetical protein
MSPTSTLARAATASGSHSHRRVADALSALARARRSGGPLDRALYSCGCGHAFKATVSTTVDCPSCGRTQAW